MIDEVPTPVPVAAIVPTLDLLAAAELCTALGRVENASQMPRFCVKRRGSSTRAGLIVWVWDTIAEELQPALVYGYPDKLLAQLPGLKPDADNLTAAAFRVVGDTRDCGERRCQRGARRTVADAGRLRRCARYRAASRTRGSATRFAPSPSCSRRCCAQLVGGAPAASQLPADGRPSIARRSRLRSA